jgi:hypothetical protein
VKEFYAYVGDKKVFYERNRDGGKTFPVQLEIPLQEGSNRVVLAARDQKDLQTNRTLFIFRTEPLREGAGLGMR